jgi:glycosyltransferase involved in cell wall biosynthesis
VKWDVPLLEGYKYMFLPVLGRRDHISWWCPFAYGLWGALRAGLFDTLWIPGYAHQAYLKAVVIAKLLGIKVLLQGESHLKSHPRTTAKMWLKTMILPRFFKAIDGFLAIGTLNREYYLYYDVLPTKIFMMPYAVDNAFFQKKAEEARPYRESLRTELKLESGRPVILYASKFQPRKRPCDILEAYLRLSPDDIQEPRPYLLFIGDGTERSCLEARVRGLSWSSVKFLGFKNQSELPKYYDLCDVFVLPSDYEPWGLVVNEVMNVGKAVIVSDQVGAGPDLVSDGQNGFIVPVGDVTMLAERLRCLVDNPDLARRMGKESQKRISVWNFDADCQGLLQALDSVVGPNHYI